jgi:vacuolar protein sorting-associated protein IST1
MAVQRIQIANNKRVNGVKHQKQKISQLLAEHKDEKARIQVEHIIRDDFTIEGYEVLELMCELVHERIRQVTTSVKDPPEEMKEAIASLIWASRNVDIEELRNVRQQLRQKYTAEFVKQSETNENNLVNPRLYAKLTYKPPSQYLVVKYLEEIARAYNVDWTPSSLLLNAAANESTAGGDEDGKGANGGEEVHASKDAPFSTPSGSSIQMAPASGFASAYAPTLIAPAPNARFPGMTVDEEREMEAANKLRAAGATYSVPVPSSAAPTLASLANAASSNPHVGIPAIPFNPQKSAHQQASAPVMVTAQVVATAHFLDDEEAFICQQAAIEIEEHESRQSGDKFPSPLPDPHNSSSHLSSRLSQQQQMSDPEAAEQMRGHEDVIDRTVAPDVNFFTNALDETADSSSSAPAPAPAPGGPEDPLAALQARLAALNQNR